MNRSRNPGLAAQLNRDFVAIKVDREERPDLDDVYMAAVQTLTGGGGWPMSVFLTPSLEPFFGGTYFPPEDRHGLPAFSRVLSALAEAYRDRRDEVAEQGRLLAAHLQEQLDVAPGRAEVERRQLDAAAVRIGESFDPKHGGFGGAPKFPAPMTIEFLLRTWRRGRDPEMLRSVTVTLERMAAGGIHDQIGGGFARYSTDARWLVPHFEKMLYDNAQLAHAYLEAFRATGDQRHAEVARRTLDFMLGELATGDGGFASALDDGQRGRGGSLLHLGARPVPRDAARRRDRGWRGTGPRRLLGRRAGRQLGGTLHPAHRGLGLTDRRPAGTGATCPGGGA